MGGHGISVRAKRTADILREVARRPALWLLQPLSRKADKGLSDRIDAAFTEINEKLAKYRGPDGRFASGAGPDRSETEALMKLSVALADDIGKLNAALGLE